MVHTSCETFTGLVSIYKMVNMKYQFGHKSFKKGNIYELGFSHYLLHIQLRGRFSGVSRGNRSKAVECGPKPVKYMSERKRILIKNLKTARIQLICCIYSCSHRNYSVEVHSYTVLVCCRNYILDCHIDYGKLKINRKY